MSKKYVQHQKYIRTSKKHFFRLANYCRLFCGGVAQKGKFCRNYPRATCGNSVFALRQRTARNQAELETHQQESKKYQQEAKFVRD